MDQGDERPKVQVRKERCWGGFFPPLLAFTTSGSIVTVPVETPGDALAKQRVKIAGQNMVAEVLKDMAKYAV